MDRGGPMGAIAKDGPCIRAARGAGIEIIWSPIWAVSGRTGAGVKSRFSWGSFPQILLVVAGYSGYARQDHRFVS